MGGVAHRSGVRGYLQDRISDDFPIGAEPTLTRDPGNSTADTAETGLEVFLKLVCPEPSQSIDW